MFICLTILNIQKNKVHPVPLNALIKITEACHKANVILISSFSPTAGLVSESNFLVHQFFKSVLFVFHSNLFIYSKALMASRPSSGRLIYISHINEFTNDVRMSNSLEKCITWRWSRRAAEKIGRQWNKSLTFTSSKTISLAWLLLMFSLTWEQIYM